MLTRAKRSATLNHPDVEGNAYYGEFWVANGPRRYDAHWCEDGKDTPVVLHGWRSTRGEYDAWIKDTRRNYDAMEHCRRVYSFAIPTREALGIVAKYGPIVEVGAGTGYWARLLQGMGVKVVPIECDPPMLGENHYHKPTKHWANLVHGDGPTLLAEYPAPTLMLCWPPYQEPLAIDALKAHQGDTLVYIGESDGGCTGDQAFHDELQANWHQVEFAWLPQWNGLHDNLYVYKRGAT